MNSKATADDERNRDARLPNATELQLLRTILGYLDPQSLQPESNTATPQHTRESIEDTIDSLIAVSKHDLRIRDLLPLAYHEFYPKTRRPDQQAYLRKQYIAFRALAVKQHHMWRGLLQEMINAGLEPILLKGSSIALDYFDDDCVRRMTDIDILVPQEKRDIADTVLKSGGWKWQQSSFDTSDTDLEHAIPYTRDGEGAYDVDLHVHVLGKLPHDAIDQWFFDRTEAFEYCGTQVRRFDPTALLMHLLLHGFQMSHSNPIRWIVDSHMVLSKRGGEIDWQSIVDFSTEHRFLSRIGLALDYLKSEFSSAIPEQTLRDIAAYKPGIFERLETRILLSRFPRDASLPTRLAHLLASTYVRAARLRGGRYLPVDFYRLFRHKSGEQTLSRAIKRAWKYGLSNK